MKKVKYAGQVVTASLASALIAQSAFAAGYADITAAVDVADVIVGFFAVAAVIATALVTRMGIRKVLGMIR